MAEELRLTRDAKWAAICAATCSVVLVAAGGSTTGARASDLVWAVLAGAVVGWCGTWATGPWITVGVTLVAGLLQLPGPFGLETVVGFIACGWLVVRGIRCGALESLTESRTWARRRRVAGAAILLVGLGATGVMGWTAWNLAAAVREVKATAMGGVADLKAYNVEDGLAKLRASTDGLAKFDELLKTPGGRLMGVFPLVGQHRQFVADLVGPLTTLMKQSVSLAEMRPDEHLTLKNGRLDLREISALDEPLRQVTDAAHRVLIIADRRRSGWLVPWVANPFDKTLNQIRIYTGTLETTRRVLKELPWFLGQDRLRTYFVPILSPVENRSGGGFPGAFAVVTADKGRLRVGVFGNIGKVADGGNPFRRVITGPEDYVARYQQYGAGDGVSPARNYFWSNVTVSPDFPSVSQVIAQLYPQSGGTKVDGVIALDVRGLAALLRITGPVQLTERNVTLNGDNAEQFLLRQQYFDLNTISNQQRHDMLYTAAGQIASRLTSMTMPNPATLSSTLGPAVANGNIRMWFAHKSTEDLMHYLGSDGEFGSPESVASVAVTNTNGAPNKIDMFLTRKIDHSVTISADGNVKAVTTIAMRNDAPAGGLDDYVLANVKGWPNGSNVTILNFYSPLLDCTTTTNGNDTPMASEMELGWFVHSLYMGLPPKSTTTVVVTCTGTTTEAGVGVGIPKVRGQVVASDDEWAATVTSAKGRKRWRFAGKLNSNQWMALTRTK